MSATAATAHSQPTTGWLTKAVALAALLIVSAWFVYVYVFPYYLHYSPEQYGVYWIRRGGLLLHISGGTVALLIGPWQFSERLRRRRLQLHRVMGRTYLVAIACGATGAFYMGCTTPFGWAWGTSLVVLALVWATSAGMALYAVKRRQIQVHREWMIRSYIVTFAFVTFRMLNDMGPTSHLKPLMERSITFVWVSWTIPLILAEVILQLRAIRSRPAMARQA
jgi:uncharacterized membrane protein